MNKTLSYKWAIAVAFLFLFLQILFFGLGFQTLDSTITVSDYFAFFISGLTIGAALIYFLRRCATKSSTRGTIIAFVLGIPFAVLGMFLGGPSGSFGTFLFSISPAIFVTAIGFFIGQVRGKKK